MLQNHVFPLFRSELGYMRARVSDRFATGSPKICVFNITEWGGFELGPACFTGLVLAFVYLIYCIKWFLSHFLNLCFHTGLLGAALLLRGEVQKWPEPADGSWADSPLSHQWQRDASQGGGCYCPAGSHQQPGERWASEVMPLTFTWLHSIFIFSSGMLLTGFLWVSELKKDLFFFF